MLGDLKKIKHLKILILTSIFVGLGQLCFGQTLIVQQDFDGGTPTWGGGTFGIQTTITTLSSGASDGPASTPYYYSANHALAATNESATGGFRTGTVYGLGSYLNKYLEFKLASFSLGSAADGADNADNVKVAFSFDGGATYSATQLTVKGNSNAYWSYAGTSIASATYGTPAIIAANGGGNRADGHATCKVLLPDTCTRIKVQITWVNNSAAERWALDDIKMYGDLICTPPTVQASSVTASSITNTGGTINFTAGNGTNRLVVVKSGSAITGTPINGNTYTANTIFGSGSTIATNEYVTYTGTGNSVSITGLTDGTTYYVSVFEFDNALNCYKTTSPAAQSFTTTASALSDITAVAASESNTVSSLTNTAGPLTSVQGTQVWQFTIRDGGSGTTDADALPTTLTALTITNSNSGTLDWSTAIKSIDLFDGATNIGSLQYPSASITSSAITFTGLNVSAADNGSKTLTLRLTVNCGLGAGNADGAKFRFNIANAGVTFSSAGSSILSTFTSVSSSSTKNVIDAVATQLTFTTQPSNTGQNQLMYPSVVVAATDVCGNTDIAFTNNITLTSSSTMTGGGVVAPTSGASTYASLVHSVVGNNYTLTATASGVTSATSNTFNIITVTNYGTGDIAIVGLCSYSDTCLGSGGQGIDEISFVSFEDILPGTTIDLTDNGFERGGCSTNTWGNTEGVIRLTRTTSTITKGTIVTIRNYNETVFAAVQPDANWTVSYPNTGSGNYFDMNSSDEQIYVLQGGVWAKNTVNGHNATYTGGTMMFAINTFTSWNCGVNSTQRGDLPLALRCYSIMPGIAAKHIKYTGPTTSATQKDWIDRLNSTSNWTGKNSCAAYNSVGLDYSGASQTFTILAGGFSAGNWTGATNTDWFDCNNWQNFKIPDSTANVAIDNVANDPVIGASPALYPTGAICNNLTITNTSGAGILTLNNATSYLAIRGNVSNNGTISATLGTTAFRSTSSQSFSGSGTTSLYDLTLNNSAGLSLTQDITVTNTLNFTAGVFTTGTNKLIITNTTMPTITGYTSSKFINGNLRHSIASNTSTYIFPIGDGTATTNYKRIDLVNNNLAGISYIDAFVSTVTETPPNDDATFLAAVVTQDQNGSGTATQLTNVMEAAQWDLTPNASPSGGSYGVNLYVANTGLSGADDNTFCPVKRPSNSVTYANWVTLNSSTTIPALGAAGRIYNSANGYAQRLGYTSFSKHAIAKAGGVLPIELLNFDAKKKGKNVELTWSTASEINSKNFVVEHGTNAENLFAILSTPAAGYSTSLKNYLNYDFNPNVGINYYRLKEIDFDGKYIYSDVRMIEFEESNKSITNIYKTAEDQLRIETNSEDKSATITIYDAAGRLILNESIILGNGVANLPFNPGVEGMYFVKLVSSNIVVTQKIVY